MKNQMNNIIKLNFGAKYREGHGKNDFVEYESRRP